MKGFKKGNAATAKSTLIVVVMAILWTTCTSIVVADQSESNSSVSGQTSVLPVFNNMSGPHR